MPYRAIRKYRYRRAWVGMADGTCSIWSANSPISFGLYWKHLADLSCSPLNQPNERKCFHSPKQFDILPAIKGGDSYQFPRFARATFGGFLLLTSVEVHFTSSTAVSQPDIYAQTRARPRAKTFNAPTTSAFSV